MRRPFTLASLFTALAVLACVKSEQPAADTSVMTIAPSPLTEAEFSGTWTGTAKLAGTDSVFLHWTQVCGGGNCTGTTQEAPDTVKTTYRIEGDSAIGVSAPFADATQGGTRVMDNWIARVSGATVSGRGWSVLADKPDSVLARYTFEGTRK